MKDPKEIKIHEDKVKHWLEKGALVSESAKAILKREGSVETSPATY
jgi:ribosomal protein S16